jgi:hypothetical protein
MEKLSIAPMNTPQLSLLTSDDIFLFLNFTRDSALLDVADRTAMEGRACESVIFCAA